MKTMYYTGFTRKTCSCKYAVTKIAGKPAVVFVQSAAIQTSITNTIEQLASKILAKDFRGSAPDDIRFFEYYPPALQPLRVWQEVTFKVHNENKAKGLIAKIVKVYKDFIGADKTSREPFWSVDHPEWQPVEPALEAKLLTAVR